jgi:hypothetical protein
MRVNVLAGKRLSGLFIGMVGVSAINVVLAFMCGIPTEAHANYAKFFTVVTLIIGTSFVFHNTSDSMTPCQESYYIGVGSLCVGLPLSAFLYAGIGQPLMCSAIAISLAFLTALMVSACQFTKPSLMRYFDIN